MPDNNSDPVAAFDQIGTMLENSAVMFGTYYQALLKNNIPPDLAYKLVVDIHLMLFGKKFGSDSGEKKE